MMHSGFFGLALALAILAGATHVEAAKRCRLLCRDQVRACVADARARIACTGLRGGDRRDCRRELNHAVRTCKSMRGPILSACTASTSVETCSPSGAFVEGSEG